jgi:hypothetical protein
MSNPISNPEQKSLSLTGSLKPVYFFTIIIALLMAAASVAGIFFPSVLYPSKEMVQTFLPNDLINLFIGLPLLLLSMLLTRRESLVGLLIWPGSLLYVVYNYIGYIFGIPFSLVTLGLIALVLLSGYAAFAILKAVDTGEVQARLDGKVPVKTAGWVMLVFGVIFIFQAASTLWAGVTDPGGLPPTEIGVLVADIVLSILWVAGGALLLRRLPLGYTGALGLLFVASALFIGLIAFLLLQPALTGAPFSLTDVLVVLVMGLVCFVPFGLYLRGVLSAEKGI